MPVRHKEPILNIPKWNVSDGAVELPTFKSLIPKR